MRRVPSSPAAWATTRPRQSKTGAVRSFLLLAAGSIGTFLMAARAVHWLGVPVWLGLVFAGAGIVLAGYFLTRFMLASRARRLRGKR